MDLTLSSKTGKQGGGMGVTHLVLIDNYKFLFKLSDVFPNAFIKSPIQVVQVKIKGISNGKSQINICIMDINIILLDNMTKFCHISILVSMSSHLSIYLDKIWLT